MPKRSRNNQETINDNIEKIKNITIQKREIYEKYVASSEIHNLVIEKVKEKLNTDKDLKEDDVNHFKGVLRKRYDECFKLLHESSDKVKELTKKHFDLLEENAKLRDFQA
jgi:hypothetical protein